MKIFSYLKELFCSVAGGSVVVESQQPQDVHLNNDPQPSVEAKIHQNAKRRKRKIASRKLRTAQTDPDYRFKGDSTAIDNLIGIFQRALPLDVKYSVSGLRSIPRRSRTTNLEFKSPANGEQVWLKNYKIGFRIPRSTWRLDELVDELRVVKSDLLESGAVNSDFYEKLRLPLVNRVRSHLPTGLSEVDPNFSLGVGVLGDGGFSVWVDVRLPVTSLDLVTHCGTDLTDYPKSLLEDFVLFVGERLKKDPSSFKDVYEDLDFRFKFMREVEQAFRKKNGVARIGEGNVTQHALFKLIRVHFPKAVYEYSPRFLMGQRYDIYIPSLKLAIEYNGIQHYQPVQKFGGADGFEQTKMLDERKRQVSAKNGVRVYEWHYQRSVNSREIEKFITEIQNNVSPESEK